MRYLITPTPKPRMTRRDKWSKRPAVLQYHAFKDECRLHRVQIPESGGRFIFTMPMPESWSKKKRAEMNGEPHQQRPDIDNILKALFDAVLEEDSHIWQVSAEKRWGIEGSIEILEEERK